MKLVALEKEEVLQLLEAARRHSARAHTMVLLAIRHGLRVSEVTGLRVEHVNMQEGWVRVERLKGSLTTVQTLERHPGQPLLDEVRVLNRWLRARRDDGSDVLFVSSHGGQMNRSTPRVHPPPVKLSTVTRRALARLGLDKLGPHVSRSHFSPCWPSPGKPRLTILSGSTNRSGTASESSRLSRAAGCACGPGTSRTTPACSQRSRTH